MKPSFRPLLAVLVLAIVVAAIVGGLLIVGSPGEARLQRLDDRRVSDLRQLSSAVNVYWTRNRQLPVSLDAALPGLSGSTPPLDPGTGQRYTYRAIEGDRYELCAVFSRASADGAEWARDPFWSHTAGRQCFTLEAKDLTKDPGR